MPDSPPGLPSRTDVLTPIHKAIRSMIYDLAGRLQSTDWTDPKATDAVLADLRHEFTAGVPAGCLLCLVHLHGGHEDTLFPRVRAHDAKLIDELMEQHRSFGRDLQEIGALGAQLARERSPDGRADLGKRVNQQANEFFARYFAHMNREETVLVPLMNRHFTDAELVGMRTTVERSMAPDRLREFHRWMLRSLSTYELTGMFVGMKKEAPPPVLAYMRGVAEESVEPARWAQVRERAGL